MNLQYIKQLLEEYMEGRATPAQEKELRNLFLQEGIPKELEIYRQLFQVEDEIAAMPLEVLLGKPETTNVTQGDESVPVTINWWSKLNEWILKRFPKRFYSPLLQCNALLVLAFITCGSINNYSNFNAIVNADKNCIHKKCSNTALDQLLQTDFSLFQKINK